MGRIIWRRLMSLRSRSSSGCPSFFLEEVKLFFDQVVEGSDACGDEDFVDLGGGDLG